MPQAVLHTLDEACEIGNATDVRQSQNGFGMQLTLP